MADESLDFNVKMDPQAVEQAAWMKSHDAQMCVLMTQAHALRARVTAYEQHNLAALATYKDASGCYPEAVFHELANELDEVARGLSLLSDQAELRYQAARDDLALVQQAASA